MSSSSWLIFEEKENKEEKGEEKERRKGNIIHYLFMYIYMIYNGRIIYLCKPSQ